MVTRNFKNMLEMVLTASTTQSQYAGCQVIDVNGRSWFLNHKTYFPYTITASLTTAADAAGISIGSGNSIGSLDDNMANLINTITSGVTLTLTGTTTGADSFGAPYLEYQITVTNTGSEELTIREVGYKQRLYCMQYVGDNSTNEGVACLLDRTELETPLVIQPGDAGVLHYRLAVFADREKAGVKLVSFSFGTDEEIAAMIDAARNGTIDLQTDGGWRVGDMRRIHLDAWTGGNNVSHAATDLDIVIAEFGDYNGCGCLFQFEFFEFVYETQCMASRNTNVGGYSATEMYTTTLPAMTEALPTWLKTRLKIFNVLVGVGNGSSEIEAVSSKLALRSEVEVFGTSEHSAPGEGTMTAQNKLGKNAAQKYRGGSFSGNYLVWWLRSPCISNNTQFVGAGFGSATGTSYVKAVDLNASGTYGVSPFGCV